MRLTGEQFTDIVNDQSTPIALMSNGVLDMPEGGLPDSLNWWLILRSALDGRRIHLAGDVEFTADPRRSFTPEDSDGDMRRFLEEFGYLHIRGLFSVEEMAAVDADTRTGDVTVHLSCTQHMSQPPVRWSRKVLYTGFGQVAQDAEQAAANRDRLSAVRSKTHTTVSQQPGYLGD